VSCKGGNAEGGNGRLTEFAMGMLDTSTGLLKALPKKPALSRVGSESENMCNVKRNLADSYGYGGFGIGPPRVDGSVGEGESFGVRSGLVSPSTSVSSSGESAGFEAYAARPTAYSGSGVDEMY